MKIEKTKSGKYRIRLMEKGKTYCVTLDYKPTQREAYQIMQDKINHISDTHITLDDACNKYISSKNNVLSPSTIRGYKSIIRSIPETLKCKDIMEIDDYVLQNFINDFTAEHSAKTVINTTNFIKVCIKFFLPKSEFSVSLPKKQSKDIVVPEIEDVKALLNEAKDTRYYVPIYLACLSLRLSEICALELSDLDGDILTINKALVRGESGYVVKPCAKTDKSNRTVVIPKDLADTIREQGFIYNGYPNQIDKYLYRTLPKLGIDTFSIHKMRHFFASYSHDLGYSDALVMEIGGWKSDRIMKQVYRHAMKKDQAKKSIASDFDFDANKGKL